MDEANVEEGVRASYRSHEKLNNVPLVEGKKLLIVEKILNSEDNFDFPNAIEQEVDSVDDEQPIVECFLACMNLENRRKYEDNNVVDESPKVEHLFGSRHNDLFNLFDLPRVILETESFMLIVNQGFPAPDGEDNFLPERSRMVVMLMVIVLQHMSDVH